MEAIQNLTRTLNVFVRFFESINCLFWQINWLERNVSNASGEKAVIFVLIFCLGLFITFGGDQFEALTPYLVVMGLFALVAWLAFKRYRTQQSQHLRNDNELADAEAFIPSPWHTQQTSAPYEPVNQNIPIGIPVAERVPHSSKKENV